MRIAGLSLLLALAVLAGCSSQPFKDGYPTQESWVVLPAQSLEVAEYGIQIERILNVLLAKQGIARVVAPPDTDTQGNNILLSGTHRLKHAEEWAKQHDHRFGMTGSVDFATSDTSSRFRIGLTLRLIDLTIDDELWSVSGESEGKPGEDPVLVIRNLLSNLLSKLPLQAPEPAPTTPAAV